MRFDKTADVIIMASTSDGLGGYETVENYLGTIAISTAEIAQDLTLNQYGYQFATDLRVFTKHKGLKQGDYLKINDKPYRIIRVIDYRHISSLVVRAE